MNVTYHPLGDQAVLIHFKQEVSQQVLADVQFLKQEIQKEQPVWMFEAVPGYASIAVHYDLSRLLHQENPYQYVVSYLEERAEAAKSGGKPKQRTVKIPVCYGGELGPDIEEVAEHAGLSSEEVIKRHQNGDYTVYMLGFAPGFPYIGGLDPSIAAPRKDNPRAAIPAGSVGIAGEQTGVYSIETPGGWQIIGRTPEKLFDLDREESFLLRAGDKIEFYSITQKEFEEWQR
ncbi:5-oxoprolinase subunit PxpB [Jeotgalibacillus salarius]|uniref:5-oxoprolinase subunit PxpB n=1 Tax=Jeotgalibacillus salarius TaxID=546023 RepID=A0A4Y8LFZ6_9BACL|nr:5-oxoprolinase subunit PxpB [Jeotgalibacillus salarius]TFE01748.1 5-oxoprolinase subunit PxpB [Jeotgalibacillus salarius]